MNLDINGTFTWYNVLGKQQLSFVRHITDDQLKGCTEDQILEGMRLMVREALRLTEIQPVVDACTVRGIVGHMR